MPAAVPLKRRPRLPHRLRRGWWRHHWRRGRAGAAFIVSAIGQSVFPQKQKKQASLSPQAAAIAGFDAASPRRPHPGLPSAVTEHQLVLGRCKVSGRSSSCTRMTDDQGRADGYFYSVWCWPHIGARHRRGVFGRQGRERWIARWAGADRPASR